MTKSSIRGFKKFHCFGKVIDFYKCNLTGFSFVPRDIVRHWKLHTTCVAYNTYSILTDQLK